MIKRALLNDSVLLSISKGNKKYSEKEMENKTQTLVHEATETK